MRDVIIENLSSHIETSIVHNLIATYEELLSKHRSGDLEGALTKAGRFVEYTLIAIEYLRTSTVLTEIKSIQKTVHQLENQTALPESLRLLIPRVVYGMIYNLRSKRDVVHVKEIDPTQIDVSLAVAAASWVVAELIRLYHVSDEKDIASAMVVLSRTVIPMIEKVGGDVFVAKNVPATIEMLLLLVHARPLGVTRRDLAKGAKCSQTSVTTALQSLLKARHVHLAANNCYFITSEGEQHLACQLAELA